MAIQNSSNANMHTNQKSSESTDQIICKDGFCFLPNKDEANELDNKNIDIFDPV